MKYVRKVVAAVMAVTCLSSVTAPLSSTATYDPCDVNRDGSVNMGDVLCLNKHLLGVLYYTDYNQLDANQSHTVDATDVNCVMQKALNMSYTSCYIRQYPNAYMEPVNMPAISSTVTLDSSVATDATNSRWYVGYSYLEDAPIDRYELTATMDTLTSTQNAQARSLINGDDNRGVAHGYENTGIVYIRHYGTGFIVGDHHIATAAHCVGGNNGIYENLEILTYDRTGLPVEDGGLTIAEIHIPEDYSSTRTDLDYALITVQEDLSEYIHFEIGNSYNMTNTEAGSIPIHVTGMPAEVMDPETNTMVRNEEDLLYTHYGSVYGTNNVKFFKYTVDTTGNQSGAPVYTITRERYNNDEFYTYTALAVHTAGGGSSFNNGVLMTKYHQLFYNNNPYANYQ